MVNAKNDNQVLEKEEEKLGFHSQLTGMCAVGHFGKLTPFTS